MSNHRIVLSLVFFLSAAAVSQGQKIESNPISTENSVASRLPDAPSATLLMRTELDEASMANETETKSEQCGHTGLTGFVKRGVKDQAYIYTAPFHRKALKW